MTHKKNGLAIFAEYALLNSLLTVLQKLPFALSRFFCRCLLRGLLQGLGKKRRLIDAQMHYCFPERSGPDRQALADRFVESLGDSLAAFARIPRMNLAEMRQWITIEGFEHVEEAFRKGRGMITFTGHFGCWEMMAVYVTRVYPRVAMLARPLDNPKLNELVLRIRQSGGGRVIESHRVFKEGIRVLRSNGILGILIDQNFYKGGIFVDFFGRAAATTTLVPVLARRTGCAVLPMHNVWRNGKIHIVCEPPVALSQNPDASSAIAEDTQQLTAVVERWVREDPSQWLWLHNRWKRRPEPGEPIFNRGVWIPEARSA